MSVEDCNNNTAADSKNHQTDISDHVMTVTPLHLQVPSPTTLTKCYIVIYSI